MNVLKAIAVKKKLVECFTTFWVLSSLTGRKYTPVSLRQRVWLKLLYSICATVLSIV